MGQGTIVSESGEGLYTVSLDYGSDIANQQIAKLNARLSDLTTINAALQIEKNAATALSSGIKSDLNSAISAYSSAISGGGEGKAERATVDSLTKDLLKSNITAQKIDLKYDLYGGESSSISREIAYLSGLDLEAEVDAWCVDYTLEAEGEVGTIEVPGEPAKTLIVPECAAPSVDGDVIARPVQDEKQLFVNLAMLPGWQKYKPTYRLGEITIINIPDNECDITLDSAASSAQGLDINQGNYLVDVPIEYMECDATVFEDGDRVLVQFVGQNWESPKVIGFESDPRPCFSVVMRTHLHAIPDGFGAGADDHRLWQIANPSREEEELRDIFEAGIVPDLWPSNQPELTDLEFWVKPHGRSWAQMGFSSSNPVSPNASWKDSRNIGGPEWYAYVMRWGIITQNTVVGTTGIDQISESYQLWLAREHLGSLTSDPGPGEIDIGFQAQERHYKSTGEPSYTTLWNYQTQLPGMCEFLIRKTDAYQTVLVHFATNMKDRKVSHAIPNKCKGYYAKSGGRHSPIPDFDLTYDSDYTLSAPPP